ncbi:MAG: FecR domain-containing protein, partial [Candidatus Marinimicrobia bacterium]|nr:FecR domain-containing protein [Candidatus Neomarinimicrobiota bacterium]
MKSARLIIPLFFLIFSFLSAETIARLVKASGTVRLKQVTASEFNILAKPGMRIGNGDVIRVESASFAVVLYLDDKSIIKIKENSQFQFVDSENTRTIDLEIGTLINEVRKENRSKTFRIQTPTSVASVKGTIFGVIVDASGIDQFYGQEGLFEVFNLVSGQTVAVGPGQKALSSPTGNVISAPAAATEFPVDPDPNAGTGELEQLIEQYSPKPGETLPEEYPQDILPEDAPTPQPETGPATPEADVPQSAPSPPSKSFGMGFGVGSVTIDGIVYNQLAFRPELKFGKLGLGFDLVVYLNNEGNIRQEEWDEPTDIADKFLYIRWAEKGDPFWIKLGALENVVLGYGGLLSGYSNMMEFPTVRQIGVNGGFGFGSFGVELFMSNLKDFSRGGTLMGFRGSYTVSKQFPLSFGANLVMDLNQFSGLVDRDDDTYPDAYDDFPNDKQFWNDTDGDGIPDPHVGTDSTMWDTDSDNDQQFDPWIGGSDQDLVLKGEPFSIQGNKAAAIGYALDVGYPIIKSKMAQLTIFAEWSQLSFAAAGDSGSAFFRPEDRTGYGVTIPGLQASLFK